MLNKVPETARKLARSVPGTWALIYRGELPFVRIGRSVLVRDEDITDFIKQHLTRHETAEEKRHSEAESNQKVANGR
jgi:excisionase family DNA binding protein